MQAHTLEVLARAEQVAKSGDLEKTLSVLRELALDDFGRCLLEMPLSGFPALSAVLPAMAPEEVQRGWTGDAGVPLLKLTVNFARSLHTKSMELGRGGLTGKRILDFGCGYGRIGRLMYYHTAADNYWGLDPMQQSLDECAKARMPGHFALSDYVPKSLPAPENHFDMIFAFSVFTHLSEKTARTCLATLRRHVAPNGLLAITIRSEEYWPEYRTDYLQGRTIPGLIEAHRTGFAFVPHNLPPIDGDITYGDAGTTMDWIRREIPEWSVATHDFNISDPYQIIVFLKPA